MGNQPVKQPRSTAINVEPPQSGITDEERRTETDKAYNEVVDRAVKVVEKEYKWRKESILADKEKMSAAGKSVLDTTNIAKTLVTDGIYDTESAAKAAILVELQKHFGATPSAPSLPAAPTLPAVQGWVYPFYTMNFKGNDALVVYITWKKINSAVTSYSETLMEMTATTMRSVNPPNPAPGLIGEAAARDILLNNDAYVASICAAYAKAIEATSGKTDTQLGLRAGHVTYK